MARPRKNIVDYFPHNCKHGQTLFILEQRFDHGYKFFFKLLEALGGSENHYLNLNNDTEFEFLGAKTKLSIEEMVDMLDLLAKLSAIDKVLWSRKVVWSQNFVDGIADVYRKRNNDVPEIPILEDIKGVSDTGNKPTSTKETKVSEADFELFWELYPNKKAKKKAKDKFIKINKNVLPALMSGLRKQIKSEAWIKSDGEFIPHPTTWLNGERWEDVMVQENANDSVHSRKEWKPPA